MPKLIVSIDGVVIKEVQLTKARTSLGRRPYNDVVIDNLTVSGEHAVLVLTGVEALIEDLSSTNGTYVNGKAIRRQALRHNDLVQIGKHKVKFLSEAADSSYERAEPAWPSAQHPIPAPPTASIRVLSGAAAGREVALVKVVTTIGKPGIAVAAITRRPQGYVVVHVEGADPPLLNGAPVGSTPVALKNSDVLQLAGTQMQFMQAG